MDSNPLHDKTNYQGTKLAALLLALAVPPLLYYLRIAFAFAASRAQAEPLASVWLMRSSTAALVLFFVAQLAAAWYMRRLLRRPRSGPAQALQVTGIALVCGAFSIGAAVLLESFAYELLIRTRSY